MVEEIIRKNEKGKDEIVRTRILINGKEARLRFTQKMWYRMEDEICVLDDLYTMMHSKGRFKKDKIPALAELMTGGEITAEEVIRDTDPATMRALIDEIQRVIAQAVTMKEKKYDDDSIHDEVLEEIEKKDQRAD